LKVSTATSVDPTPIHNGVRRADDEHADCVPAIDSVSIVGFFFFHVDYIRVGAACVTLLVAPERSESLKCRQVVRDSLRHRVYSHDAL